MRAQHKKDKTRISFSRPLLFAGVMLLTVLLCAFLFHLLYERFVTDTPVFFDFIIEATAESGYNKAGELRLFRLLTLCGFLLLAAGTMLINKSVKKTSAGGNVTCSSYYPLLFLFPACVYLLLSGVFSGPLFFMAGYTSLVCLLQKRHIKAEDTQTGDDTDCLLLCIVPILSYYSLLSVFTLLTLFDSRFAITTSFLYLSTIILTSASLFIYRFTFRPIGSGFSLRQFLILLQFPIPMLLTLYLRDTYLYRGRLVRIPFATGYYAAIFLLLAGCYVGLVIFFKKARKNPDALVAKVTPVVIFIYRSYQCCPMFAQPDQHHHGEQMIPWQQIIDLGQSPYREYTPVSGLFPMVNGFLQNVLMKGTVSDYAPALSLTTTLFALLTMYLITLHIGNTKALAAAVLFALPAYNRQYMVLPLLLLFYLPSLLKRKALWLRIWLFSCFLGGLYYPLFGAAVLVGTLPLFLMQLSGYIKSGALKDDLKKASFYIGWLICLIPIALCLPLLSRMGSHTLTYSSQTILADGISLASQQPPESFLSLFSGFSQLRSSLYLLYRFFLPAFWLWLPFLLLLICCLTMGKKALQNETLRLFCCSLLSVILTLGISYTYTLVRADVGVYLARTAPVLIAVGGLFLLTALVRLQSAPGGISPFSGREAAILAAIFCCLPFLCYARVGDEKNPALWTYPDGNDALVADDVSKLFTYYEVPDTFAKMSDEQLLSDPSRLGDGFMVADQFSYLQKYDKVLQRMKRHGFDDVSYMGYDGQGFYYYLNTQACATGYLPVARSRQAQQRILENAMDERPVIFPLDPEKSYYLYRWLLSQEADYIYDRDDGCFYPAEIWAQFTDKGSAPASLSDCTEGYARDLDLRRVCQSFGDSSQTLLDQQTDEIFLPLTALDVSWLNPLGEMSVNGSAYDLLYLPLTFGDTQGDGVLPQCSRIEISFSCVTGENASVSCLTGDGNLLIPLGMNPHWLLNTDQSSVTVRLLDEGGGEILSLPLGGLTEYLNPEKKEEAGFYHISDILR